LRLEEIVEKAGDFNYGRRVTYKGNVQTEHYSAT